MARFKKGESGNPAGRTPGALNITTNQARKILNEILFAEIPNIRESLKNIRLNDEMKYLDILSKLLVYSLPKKTDLTSDDMPLQPITGMRIIKDDT